MKSMFHKTMASMAFFAVATTFAGCAAPQGTGSAQSAAGQPTQEEHQAHHPEGAAQKPAGQMGPRGSGGQPGMMGGGGQPGMMGGGQPGMMGGMDMKSMCDMHNRMMQGKTPEQQAEMMNERMKGMSPEQRQMHEQMLRQNCR